MSRRILILAHTGREAAISSALQTIQLLHGAGLTPVMTPTDVQAVHEMLPNEQMAPEDFKVEVLDTNCQLTDIDMGVVLGGDGSVLRAAEFLREAAVPLMAINLGHVGFLAEYERSDIVTTVQSIANEQYHVEERMTIDVRVMVGTELVAHTWALNEASVEKSNRERMLEVVIGVDDRPISTFGCDGVVMATPTGSTAYAFSGGGPVVWPEVQAMLMVPLSAHALFARPLVVAPESVMNVDVLQRTNENGVLWCDGRRTVDLPPGARIEVTRSDKPVRIARITQTPFSERLVHKFHLPTEGWRGSISDADRAEMLAREKAREGNQDWRQHLADSSGVDIVEPHHLAPRLDIVPPVDSTPPTEQSNEQEQ